MQCADPGGHILDHRIKLVLSLGQQNAYDIQLSFVVIEFEGGKEDLPQVQRPAKDGSRNAWQGLPGETVRVANDLQVEKLYRCVIQVL